MSRPQFSLKALFVFVLFAALPSACIYGSVKFAESIQRRDLFGANGGEAVSFP